MAARIHKIRHDEETRARIQTTQIIKRLTQHMLGKIDMKTTQVTAALGLLKKSLPDLASIEHAGKEDAPILHEIKIRLVKAGEE